MTNLDKNEKFLWHLSIGDVDNLCNHPELYPKISSETISLKV